MASPSISQVELDLGSIVKQTMFTQTSVKMLRESDFTLDGDVKIKLKDESCMLVLFYGDNLESQNIVKIWAVASRQAVGPIFAAVNLAFETRLAKAFTELNMNNSSLHWARLKTIPFILVYQNGWPIAFYNGERGVQPIIDYSLTLACRAGYHEFDNLYGGMQVDYNYKMAGIEEYGTTTNPIRQVSPQYIEPNSLRKYPLDDRPTIQGQESAASVEKEALAGALPTSIPGGVEVARAVPVESPTERPSAAGVSPTGAEESVPVETPTRNQ